MFDWKQLKKMRFAGLCDNLIKVMEVAVHSQQLKTHEYGYESDKPSVLALGRNMSAEVNKGSGEIPENQTEEAECVRCFEWPHEFLITYRGLAGDQRGDGEWRLRRGSHTADLFFLFRL